MCGENESVESWRYEDPKNQAVTRARLSLPVRNNLNEQSASVTRLTTAPT